MCILNKQTELLKNYATHQQGLMNCFTLTERDCLNNHSFMFPRQTCTYSFHFPYPHNLMHKHCLGWTRAFLLLLLGSWRPIPSPCALWAALAGTAAPRSCPAPRPRPTSRTWRRTPGSCGDALLTSGTSGDARKTNCSRWGDEEEVHVLCIFAWI